MSTPAETAVADAFRDEWGRVVATLIRLTGDWDLAEDCAQDAFASALERWPRDGVPQRPGAWLTTTARNRAFDRLRRATTGAAREHEQALAAVADAGDDADDDRLRLLFTCCHPALALEGRVALTLRTLAGLTTAEIARAFLVPEATMAQRLVRAKRKIRHAGIPYRVPRPHELADRTSGVCGVLYLLFNEGYAATSGDRLVRGGLSGEAIHLARVLAALMPAEPEVEGLVALMLLHDSRRTARVDEAGDVVPLEEQDRSRWNRMAIEEGLERLHTARWLGRHGPAGPYALQAAIAAQHALADRPADTDWAAIAGLYAELADVLPTPVVALNRAIAVAMADGPAAGLPLLDALEAEGGLDGYHLLPATRADLLRRLGRRDAAADSYRAALGLAPTEPERRYLERRLAEVGG